MKVLAPYLCCLVVLSATARGDIFRWDDSQLIPGTEGEGIRPGPGVALDHHELAFAALSERDLTGARFDFSNLTSALLYYSTLTNANLNGAVVTGASFGDTTSRGFTQAQLASTASYQTKNLQGIGLWNNDLTGWDFSGQNLTNAFLNASTLTNADLTGANLTNAYLGYSTLTNADFTGADTRGAYVNLTRAIFRNAILPDGTIAGLDLAAGEQLVIRDDDGVADAPPQFWLTPRLPIPINIQDRLMMPDGGALELLFDADTWDSVISFETGIPVTLGGNLELSFAADADVASQIGRTFHIFDWTGVEPTSTFTVSSPYRWDVANSIPPATSHSCRSRERSCWPLAHWQQP